MNKEEKKSNREIPSITVTMIFEGSALNRGEKIGQNIQSVKKLSVNNEVTAFISKVAIRHYLFDTLKRANKWNECKLRTDKDIIQFDVINDNILTTPELDAFGYMFTGEKTMTRKSPIGITKAIALHPYNQDQAFYANHDLVRRSREQGANTNPNPFIKEEFMGLFKLSVTIDSQKFGVDTLVIDNINESEKTVTLELQKPERITLKNVELIEDDDGSTKYMYGEEEIMVIDNIIKVSKKLVSKSKTDYSFKCTPTVEFKLPDFIVDNDVYSITYTDVKKNKNDIDITFTNGGKCVLKGNKQDESTYNVKIGTGKKKKEYKIIIDNEKISIHKDLFEAKNNSFFLKDEILKDEKVFKTPIITDENDETLVEQDFYNFTLNKKPEYNEQDKTLKMENGLSISFDFTDKSETEPTSTQTERGKRYEIKDKGFLVVEKIKSSDKYMAYINVTSKIKSNRITQILEALKSGLMAHSSGESNTIVPLFMIAGAVKVPSPVFHSFIDVRKGNNGQLEVFGVNDALDNSWIDGKVYIKDCARLVCNQKNDTNNVILEWSTFLKNVKLNNNEPDKIA